MNRFRLIIRSLWHYRRSNLILFFGLVISVTVLTGGLITGDSVQNSLERLVSVRLGEIRYALTSSTFFRNELAAEISGQSGNPAAAVISTEGIAINNLRQIRLNRVRIFGVDSSFTHFFRDGVVPVKDEALISRNIAERLDLKDGDDLLLRVALRSGGPANAPFSAEKLPSVPVTVTVSILKDNNGMQKFNLQASQVAPFNIFLNMERLASAMKVQGRSNLLLSAETDHPDSILKQLWDPADAGIVFAEKEKYREMSSRQLFIPDRIFTPVKEAIPETESFLTWLVNDISSGNGSTPYSFVVATDRILSGSSPGKGEIIISSWLSEDLKVREGDSLTMRFFTISNGKELKEKSAAFRISRILPLSDPVFDRSLMPAFPGISEALNCRDWESGTPINLDRIRDKDEEYWNDYGGTPKAVISLEDGQKIWQNPYGMITTLRFPGEVTREKVSEIIRRNVDPASAGLRFDPVYASGRDAAAHATDFGGLFLGLGFFIIFSGILLSAMLLSLQMNSRMKDIRTLDALGFSRRSVFRIVFPEIMIIVILAGIAGTGAGVLYTKMILNGLSTIWLPATGTPDISLHLSPGILMAGGFSGIVIALSVLFPLIRKIIFIRKKKSLSEKAYIRKPSSFPGFIEMTLRHLQMNRWRNAGLILLLAIGVFTVIITGIFRQEKGRGGVTSGTGGFALYGETSVPLPQSLITDPASFGMDPEVDTLFRNVRVFPLARLEQDDASCLNLNRVATPTLTGVPKGIFTGRFTFFNTGNHAFTWEKLHEETGSAIIPGIVDETVLKWGLQRKAGDTLFYTGINGLKVGIVIIATIENSIFQGTLLISDSLLRKYFPSAGNTLLLVEADPSKTSQIRNVLENEFSAYGMTAVTTENRLAAFDAVQNTYLSVFLLLGGIGILLATVGLGIFFVRDLERRRGELAMLDAIGYRRSRIFSIASAPYLILLFSGLLAGILLAAILVILFSLRQSINTLTIWLILLIILNGVSWISLSTLGFTTRKSSGNLQME